MKAFIACAAAAGGVWGVWHSMQPQFFPYWPSTVADAAFSGCVAGLVAWAAGCAARSRWADLRSRWAAESRLVDRLLRDDLDQDVTP